MRIFSLLLLLTLSLWARSDSIKSLGYLSDYTSALHLAQKENKPLMLVVVTSYCPWCRKFERKSLASKSVSSVVKKYFVAVIVDRNKDAETFPELFQSPRIPVVFFIDPNSGKAFWETIGYLNRVDFLDALGEAQSLFQNR